MYYPILRGRQNELLAIRDLLTDSLLSKRIIPVVEPVKISPTLVNTMDLFYKMNHPFVFIRNPKVGSFSSDLRNEKNRNYIERLNALIEKESIIRGIIIDSNFPETMDQWNKQGIDINNILALCTVADNVKYYLSSNSEIKTIVPYAPAFRRIRNNRILLEDKFNKQEKNADYLLEPDEFFSEDHLYYAEDGYIGFSDYSVIGEEFSESGFAPRAVAIHIVYFDNSLGLRIKHFVSEDTEDTSDTAKKFYQAVSQLVAWNKTAKLKTKGISEFERIYEDQSYPGLGVVKKLSIMHHLELMSQYLDGITK